MLDTLITGTIHVLFIIFTPYGETNITRTFTFYTLVFTMPFSGEKWGVLVNGTVYYTTGSILKLILPNGVYSYEIIPPQGVKVNIVNGSINLTSNEVINIQTENAKSSVAENSSVIILYIIIVLITIVAVIVVLLYGHKYLFDFY